MALAGCGANLAEVGKPPVLSAVGTGLEHSTRSAHYYPKAPPPPVQRYSLWDDRQSNLFTDARALSIGDVLTVSISINDKAKFSNESERSRTAARSIGIAGDYDLGGVGNSGSAGLDINSSTKSAGNGQTARSENLRLSVAAIVTDVLPNGNLVISGTQEVRVNAELRVLTIAGIVRPADIGAANTISYERIAEARISYGGRGRLTEVQQPPYGQQILDQLSPF
ncbi:MAG: flagellar basal body L-ring protein FlgH [Mesorhizobium sp.]|nr:flagellar basal body L-ring protein FlgH [Mesorhizobium sp.]